MNYNTIGFLGAGQMSRALASGFVRSELVEANAIHAADPAQAALAGFAAAIPGCHVYTDNGAVAKNSEVLILAVKPGLVATVLSEMGESIAGRLLVSIAAGVRLKTLQELVPPSTRLVRVMPNTPCLVGQAASVYSLGVGATQSDGLLVERLFSAVGVAMMADEVYLDAVTGLSGSGPAYGFLIIEALADGGVAAGLSRSMAMTLAAQTLKGAAEMVLSTGEHPGALKDRVASPGGTTIAGLTQLEQGAVRYALIAAVKAAAERSRQLSGG